MEQRFDIDVGFNIHPVTKDLMIKRSKAAIKQSLRNIVLSSYHNRGFNVEFGCGVYDSLFENQSMIAAKTIQTDIINSVKNFEPDVQLVADPDVWFDGEAAMVNIVYVVFNNDEQQKLTIELGVVR